MKKHKIFIACDSSKINRVKKIIKNTNTKKIQIGYKFGFEFFYSNNGRKFIKSLKNKIIFLDLKLNDIPNTCLAAVNSIKDIKNIKYITVHINGGIKMLKAIKKNAGKIKVLGVTILTSLDNKALREIGYTKKIKDIVTMQANLARKARLDGIVCSAKEAPHLKKICKNMEIVTPGVRLPGDQKGDQKRITSPREAFNNGATSIVIGRSITKGSIIKNFNKLISHLN